MLAFLTESPRKYENLRIFNLIMGFFHLIQAGLMLYLTSQAGVEYIARLTTSFLSISGDNPQNFSVMPATEEIIGLSIAPAAALFLVISASAHFLLASPGIYEWYVNNLKRNINYARWYEYAFSSSIMIVIIAVLTGFFDAPGLLLLFTLNAMMNLFGLLMEKMNQDKEGDYDWTAYIFGCIAGIVPWIVVAWYFYSALNGYQGDIVIPDFVYAILISLFLFFNSFAINMFLQYKKVGPWKNYLFGEAVYIILSLTAKSALAWQVWSGALRGE